MQNTEKLCLRWNDFQENLNSAFGGFRNDQDFADVTLVCEDGTQIESHRVILATSSPFFMEVLKKSKHPHPLIFMKGFSSVDLMAMVDFLYFGEANVCQENLDVSLVRLKTWGWKVWLDQQLLNATPVILIPLKTKRKLKRRNLEMSQLQLFLTQASIKSHPQMPLSVQKLINWTNKSKPWCLDLKLK